MNYEPTDVLVATDDQIAEVPELLRKSIGLEVGDDATRENLIDRICVAARATLAHKRQAPSQQEDEASSGYRDQRGVALSLPFEDQPTEPEELSDARIAWYLGRGPKPDDVDSDGPQVEFSSDRPYGLKESEGLSDERIDWLLGRGPKPSDSYGVTEREIDFYTKRDYIKRGDIRWKTE